MTKILIADDSAVDRRFAGKLLEKIALPDENTPVKVVYAENGQLALDCLERISPDLVLTDLQMPQMNGLELVEAITEKYPLIPVVLMTAHGSEEIAIQALKQGASSYVPKRVLNSDLVSTVENVLMVSGARKERKRLIDHCWVQTETHYLLPNDLGLIPPMIDQLQENLTRSRVCPQHEQVRVAVAIREALSNAILHGNLQVSSELKETNEKAYYELIKTRQEEEPYRSRQVHVIAEESWSSVMYAITDEGIGFDVNSIPDPTDPANLEKASGRGLLLIRTFMDEVQFNEKGNEIVLV